MQYLLINCRIGEKGADDGGWWREGADEQTRTYEMDEKIESEEERG